MIFAKIRQKGLKGIDIKEKLDKYGLTPEAYEMCLEDIKNKCLGNLDIDWSEIVAKYSLPVAPDTIRKASSQELFGAVAVQEYFKNKNISEEEIVKKSFKTESSINTDGSVTSSKLISISEDDLKNPESLLKAHGFDVDKWELVSARNNIWNSYSKQDGIMELYSSKINVKPVNDLTMGQIEEFYKELVEKYPSPIVKEKTGSQNGLLLEIPIQDVHFGKLSLSEDVAEPYNYNLAKERFSYVVDDVINSVQGQKIEKIVFPIGSDFFHIDNVNNSTTEGTRQDTDLSPQLIFKYGLECLIENITKLSKVAPVEVFCINGNHDFLSSYHAICSLNCYFHNDVNVAINTETSPRKYVEFGRVLIGFAHGDKEKKRIEGIMQIEASEAWGRTKYREFHCGHLHSEQVKEVNGLVIRNLPSFTGTDIWHHTSGYVGALKRCQSFLWDKEYGLKSIIISTVK